MTSQLLWVAALRRWGSIGALSAAAAALMFAAALLSGPWGTESTGVAIIGLCFGAGTDGLWLMLWSAMTALAATERAMSHVGTFTCVSKLAQGASMLLLGQILAVSPYRQALNDPWSLPSLMMVVALLTITGACVALILANIRFNRTGCDGTPAMPRRVDRKARVPR